MASPDAPRWTLDPSRSFHSTLALALPSPLPPAPSPSACSLQAFVRLPPSLILDPYQLPTHPRTAFFGQVELEAPLSRAPQGGTGLRVWLEEAAERWEAKVDGRYLDPTIEEGAAGERTVEVDVPVVGWVCDGLEDAQTLLVLPPPFPATLLENQTLHPLTLSSQPPLTLTLPVGNAELAPLVELGTVGAVWACAAWVGWKAWGALRRPSRTEAGAGKEKTS